MSSIEVRIAALEYVVTIALSQLYEAADFSPEKADEFRRQVQERMSEQSLAIVSDPAISDLRSAEIVEEIDRLFRGAIELLRASPRRRGGGGR